MDSSINLPDDQQEQLLHISLGLTSTDDFYEELEESITESDGKIASSQTIVKDSSTEDVARENGFITLGEDKVDKHDSTTLSEPQNQKCELKAMDSSSESDGDIRVVELADKSKLDPNSLDPDVLSKQEKLEVFDASKTCSMYCDYICGLCKQPLQNPRTLMCLHVFCFNCLVKERSDQAEKKMEVEEDEIPPLLECPSCKRRMALTAEGVAALPTNTYLKNMAEIARSLSKNECGVCILQDVHSPAVSICTDCGDQLCEDCADKHTFTRFTLSHKVVPISEDTFREQNQNLRQKQKVMCPKHENEELKFYCQSCHCAVCRDCILLNHHNHEVVSLSTVAAGRRRDFGCLLMGLADKLSGVQSKAKKTKCNLDSAEEEEISKIRSITQDIIEQVKLQENRAIHQIHLKFDVARSKFGSSTEVAKDIQETLYMSQKVAENSMDEEFICMEPAFRQRIVSVLNKEVLPKKATSFKTPIASINGNLLDSEHKFKESFFNVTWPNQTNPKKTVFTLMDDKPSLLDIYENPEQWKDIISVNRITLPSVIQDKTVEETVGITEVVSSVTTAVPSPKKKEDLVAVQLASDSDASSVDKSKGAIPKAKKSRNRTRKKNKADVVEPSQNSHYSDLLGNFSDYGGGMNVASTPNAMSIKPGMMGVSSASYGPAFVGHVPSYPAFTVPEVVTSTGPFYSDVPVHLQQQKQKIMTPTKQQTTAVTKTQQASPQPAKKQMQVSLMPKWRLDTRIESDHKQPFLTCVHPVLPNKVVVSDSNNHKVKVFNIDGNFLEAYDAKSPTSVSYTGGVLVWCCGSDVVFQSMDKSNPFQRTLHFQQNEARHPVAWYPKKHCIVGNDNHVRFYEVSKEEEKVTRSENMSFSHDGQPLSQIISIRSDFNGNHVVVTDWNLKAFVIVDIRKNKNQSIGIFAGDSPSGQWLPGGACFDHKGNVFAVDYTANRLLHLSPDGRLMQQWNTAPTINKPWCVTCSGNKHLLVTGNDQFVHVYDFAYV